MDPVIQIKSIEYKAMVDAMELASGEFDLIHEMLDIVQIPRTIDDERLSASQRLSHYIQANRTYGNLIKKVTGGNAPN